MLRVQRDHTFPGLQQIADQKLEQEALALPGVAEDEDACVGLVVCPAVQIHDDVEAVLVLAHIEAMGVGLTGVVEREKIRHGGGGQDPLEEGAESVRPCGVGGEESLPLPQQEPVRADLGPDELPGHLLPQAAQSLQALRREVEVHGAVVQGLPVPVHGGDERGHVLEIGLRGDALLHVVGAAALQAAAVGGILDDLLLLRRRHLPGVNDEGDTAVLSQVAQECQLLRGGGVASNSQGAVVGAAEDVVVRVELHHRRRDLVQEILGQRFRRGLGLLFPSHSFPPTSRRRCCQRPPL